MNRQTFFSLLCSLALVATFDSLAIAQAPEPNRSDLVQPLRGDISISPPFTYQGHLKKSGNAVNGTCDFEFKIFNVVSGGTQQGLTTTRNNITVTSGFFTIPDLQVASNPFDGSDVWMEIGARCPSGSGTFTTLSPRQAINAAPYAISLKPGATISGTSTTAGISYFSSGLYGYSSQNNTEGVRGDTSAASGGLGGFFTNSGSGDSYGASAVFGTWTQAVPYGQMENYLHGGGPVTYYRAGGEFGGVNGVIGYGTKVGVVGVSEDSNGYGGYFNNQGGGIAVWGVSTSTVTSGYFANNGSGTALFSLGFGTNRFNASLRAYNNSTGEAAYFASSGNAEPNTFLSNTGNGGVLYMEANGGDFIRALNLAETDTQFRVTAGGDVFADGTYSSPAADFAEMMPAVRALEPGDVLIIGEDGQLMRSNQPNQTSVVGVYSTRPAFIGGVSDENMNGKAPLAVLGRVPVKVTNENGAIKPGDLLVSASLAGHAMKAGKNPAAGTVIGKALMPLMKKTGVIEMLVMMQ
jgi:hypothetical protein